METPAELSADIGRPAPLVFSNKDDAQSWIQNEIGYWSWLSEIPSTNVHQYLGGVESLIRKQLNNILNNTNELDGTAGKLNAWKNAIQRAYSNEKVPLSTDPIAKLALILLSAASKEVAASAVSAHLGRLTFVPSHSIPFAVVRGMIAAASLSDAASPEAVRAVGDSLQALSDQFSEKLAEETRAFAQHTTAITSIINSGQDALTKTEADIRQTWTEKIEDSIAKINATEAAFTKQMQLQASVNYWTNQGTKQEGSEQTYLKVVVTFASVIVLLAVAIGYNFIPKLLEKSIGDAPSLYAVSATLTLLSVTVIFWIARVLVRLYLSSHHLAADAHERVVMIQTYLALLKEGKLDEKEKALVLTPLFRPSADGIVKDEGAPDLSLAATIARLLDKKP